MADVTYIGLHEPVDDPHLHDQTLAFWPNHHDFDIYASDLEFQTLDPSVSIRTYVPFEIESTIGVRGDDDFSDRGSGSIPCTDLLDRENQVNFVMDLFQQSVELSQVIGHSDLVSEALNDLGFGDIDGHSDVGVDDGLGLDLSLGLGLGVERDSLHGDDNGGFVVENYGSGVVGDEDDFFLERRISGSESREMSVMASGRHLGFGSDSDDEENGVLGICMHSEDEYNVHDENDDVGSIPLCWDSLQLDDNRDDNNEDSEWEEVDGREVLSMVISEDDRLVSVSVSPMVGIEEEEVSVVRVGGLENLDWEVLLNASNVDDDAEPYFGDHDDYLTAEYEMMLGQVAENENPLMGRPPASISVVQKLPSVVVTKEDVDRNNTHCAVCKDDFTVGEQAKRLPCSHRYHGDCIIPWLSIRNTCPVCRYELPTDDADYEHMRAQRSGRRLFL